jgi:hypothetical protein
MDREDAQRKLRELLKNGEVVPGQHYRRELAAERLKPEAGEYVLRTGQIYAEPERDVATGEWKYRIEGREPGGLWLAIVFSFKRSDRAYLITAFSVKR